MILRSMIKSIANELKKDQSVKQKLALLKQQERLSAQLQQVVAARLEKERELAIKESVNKPRERPNTA